MEQQKLRRQQAATPKKEGASYARRTMNTKKKNAPYIEYKRDVSVAIMENIHTNSIVFKAADPDHSESRDTSETPPPLASVESDIPRRSVARKSTTTTRKPEQSATTRWEYEGNVTSTDVKPVAKDPFKSHICSAKYSIS